MKHAYLILAHTDFEILEQLLEAIDDPRNVVFIHFDAKVLALPNLAMESAQLVILENRVDISWGDVSMVAAEYALIQAAYKYAAAEFLYYHLLSGVDMPLKSQSFIHHFFGKNAGKEFIGYDQGCTEKAIERKVKYVHLFPKYFRSKCFTKDLFRAIFLRLQILLRWKRNRKITFKKGSQWVSVTHAFVAYLLMQKEQVLQMYCLSYCPDEVFIQTLCWGSSFRGNIYNLDDEEIGCLRKIGWRNGELVDWTSQDYEELINSKTLFARKFSVQDMEVVKRLKSNVMDLNERKLP